MDHDTCTARIDGLLDQALNQRTERDAARQEVAGLLARLDAIADVWHKISHGQAMLGEPLAHYAAGSPIRAGEVQAVHTRPRPTITVTWHPEEATCALIARDVLDGLVADHNALADRDRLIGQLKDQVTDLRGMLATTRPTP